MTFMHFYPDILKIFDHMWYFKVRGPYLKNNIQVWTLLIFLLKICILVLQNTPIFCEMASSFRNVFHKIIEEILVPHLTISILSIKK